MKTSVAKGKYDDKLLKLGSNIAYYRKKRGYTQEQLAEKVGIAKNYLSLIERPGRAISVSLETLFLIADVLNVPITKLLDV